MTKEYHANGKLKFISNINDEGQLHGLYTIWYDNGQIEFKASYRDGRRHGRATRWRKDGSKQSDRGYKRGLYHGLSIWWDKDGRMEASENYRYGDLVSTEKVAL